MVKKIESNLKAVILAGGKGTRLKPLTAVFPKPLVPLGNKPIIEILLRRLKSFGLNDINICTGYLSELIMAVCGNGEKYDLRIDYSKEEAPLGTAGPLGLIEGLSDPFIVMNGDLLTTLDMGKMMEFHIDQKSDFTIGAYKRDVNIDFGVIESGKDGDFVGFIEKPTYHFEVSMGINVLSRSVLQYIKKNKYLDMPNLILKVKENGGKVSCYREDCFWLDIGRMDDYALAQKQFTENMEFFIGK